MSYCKFLRGILLFLLTIGVTYAAPLSTAITYQGSLTDSGGVATGDYDFEFQLWDTASGGLQVGSTVPVADLSVLSGIFSAELDFGPGPFIGNDLWLLIRVRDGASTGAFTELLPRQPITPAPFALHAEFVPVGSITDTEIDSSTVQARVTGTCPAGSSVRTVDATGGVSCETDDVGLTSVTSADIVNGSIIAADVDNSQIQLRINGSCSGGDSIAGITDLGSVACQSNGDNDSSNELQNLFASISGDTGSTSADIQTDTLNIVGSGSVATSVVGDTLTITANGVASTVGNPVLVANVSMGMQPKSVYVSGSYSYVVDWGTDDLKIIDISVPGAPGVVGSLALGTAPTSIYVSGRYAYVVDLGSNDLKVIDISVPNAPSIVGSLGIGTYPNSVYVSGLYAYVVDQDSDDLKIINISNPGSPRLTGSIALGATPNSVFVSGRYAFVLDESTDDLKIIDVSNPYSPGFTGNVSLGTTPRAMYVSGRYVYVVDSISADLRIIDVSSPNMPVQVGSLGIGSSPESIFVSGRYAYVVDSGSSDLKVIDVSDPSTPVQAGSLGIGSSPESVFISGRYAYVVDDIAGDLKVINISGQEIGALSAHSLEAGNLQVRNDIIAQGQLQVTGGIAVGAGGIFSAGDLGVAGNLSTGGNLTATGFIQLDTVSAIPLGVTCDEPSEAGRMKFNPASDLLYICSGASGWVSK